MHRFARLLRDGLTARGLETLLLRPKCRVVPAPTGVAHWRNRFEKFIFEQRLRAMRGGEFDIIHVTDQGNAVYAELIKRSGIPSIVTCHDLSVLEEQAQRRGLWQRQLEARMRRGFRAASLVICDSEFTRGVFRHVVGDATASRVVYIGAQRSYRRIEPAEAADRLRDKRLTPGSFLLHVGAGYARKNRPLLVRILAGVSSQCQLHLVLAGDPADTELLDLASRLDCRDRVLSVPQPTDDVLEALYSNAHALLFPSLYEGFGWPIIEAQSCGCPVVCSNATCLPEIGGDGALFHDPMDAAAASEHVLALSDPNVRDPLVQRGHRNAARFSPDQMLDGYVGAYDAVLAKSFPLSGRPAVAHK